MGLDLFLLLWDGGGCGPFAAGRRQVVYETFTLLNDDTAKQITLYTYTQVQFEKLCSGPLISG